MLQYILTGIAVGSLYALLGLGLALTYRGTNVLNFAQGELAMLLAFGCYVLLVSAGFSLPVAFLLTCIGGSLLGCGIYSFVIFPIRTRNEESLAIVSLGLKLAITGVVAWWFGPGSLVFPPLFSSAGFDFAGFSIGTSQAWTIAASLVAMGLVAAFLKYAPMGLAMRVAAENLAVAQLLGVNLKVVGSAAWAAAMLIGALTGVLFANTVLLGPYMMGNAILKAFAALILGGMRSVPGVILGGFLVGISEALVAYFISPLLQDSVSLVLIITVLLVRPSGLLGGKLAWRV